MQVKFFREDGTDEVVDLPDGDHQHVCEDDQWEPLRMISAESFREAVAGAFILLVLVAGVVAIGVASYRATRGC